MSAMARELVEKAGVGQVRSDVARVRERAERCCTAAALKAEEDDNPVFDLSATEPIGQQPNTLAFISLNLRERKGAEEVLAVVHRHRAGRAAQPLRLKLSPRILLIERLPNGCEQW